MDFYRLHLKSKSSFGMPLQGDTIFGHLCWGIRLHEGEESLKQFLIDEMELPSIAVSNGFPEGFLPVPKLMPSMAPLETKEEIITLKKIKKKKYIPSDLLLGVKVKPFSINILMGLKETEPMIISILTTRNVINRLTGTTEEKSLYQTAELFADKFDRWNIYVSSIRDSDWILQRFKWAFENGYGADASTGKGWFEVERVEKLDVSFGGNRYLALGNFVPSEDDRLADKNLLADTFTKHGKLGNLSMLSDTNPFKKPLVLFTEGATFDADKERYWVGSLVKNIHKNPAYVQNTRVPVIPFTEEQSR